MSLSKEQLQNFHAFNQRLGFEPAAQSVFPQEVKNGRLILSKDPAKSSVPPKIITIKSLDELKALINAPDTGSDDHIDYLPSLNLAVSKNKSELSKDDRLQLKKIALSYVIGNPDKVGSANIELINKLSFPLTLAAFTAENYTVKSGEILTLKDGVAPNFGTLTVEQGGQIESDGTAYLSCQKLIQQGQVTSGTYTIRCELPAIEPQKAESGTPGTTPTAPGEKGQNGVKCGSHCKTSPTNGGKGTGGGNGGHGHEGLHGSHGPILYCQIANIEGNIAIYAGAQEGQKGGDGGPAGNGGPGGPPGDSPSGCPTAQTGPQGNGGTGGDGNRGGDGGDGAQVYFTYSGSGSVSPFFGHTNGATGGLKGNKGTGIPDGDDGKPGGNGNPGAPPVIKAIPN
ncbi:hypothetical protein SAMN04489724_0105 [Algoriphagus locisalis]|uniref:Uncharacterized protein n=1 Tax=Algoriphagus locisalis TaxID=305507 RepID=A0A1I7E5E7_9BACT|nr:hypothetical protein [Algoriphagus locisalis]SFU19129.1 hypothetical protein SAMN04489724_0105 [Algoriphagus locisalis]